MRPPPNFFFGGVDIIGGRSEGVESPEPAADGSGAVATVAANGLAGDVSFGIGGMSIPIGMTGLAACGF